MNDQKSLVNTYLTDFLSKINRILSKIHFAIGPSYGPPNYHSWDSPGSPSPQKIKFPPTPPPQQDQKNMFGCSNRILYVYIFRAQQGHNFFKMFNVWP